MMLGLNDPDVLIYLTSKAIALSVFPFISRLPDQLFINSW